MNEKSKKAVLISIICAVVIIIAAALILISAASKNKFQSPQESESTQSTTDEAYNDTLTLKEITENSEEEKVELTDDLMINAETLAKECQQMYENGLEEGKYISSYSYLYDLTQNLNIETQDLDNVPENTDNAAIHLLRHSDVKNYLESEPDETTLCVYTAIPTNKGILLSSKNGSGVISSEDYKSLVLSYMPDNNGEPENPKKNTQLFNELTAAITKAAGFSDYEIKHLACNDKYAVFVIGYPKKPTFIKECVMENKDDEWQITYMGIETKPNAKAEINAMYPDFDMALLPIYDIYSFISEYGLTTSAPNTEQMLIEKGFLTSEDLPASYILGTGSFIYIEGATGAKVLGYKNSLNQLEAFNVSDTFQAIAIMREKEENPPVFIIKMGDDMIK